MSEELCETKDESVMSGLSTWYMTHDYTNAILPVQVTRETEQFIYVKARGRHDRVRKLSEWRRYYSTLAEARECLLARKENKAAMLRAELAKLESDIKEIEALDLPAASMCIDGAAEYRAKES